MKKNVGILGVGNIGSSIVGFIDRTLMDRIGNVYLFDKDTTRVTGLVGKYRFAEKANSIQDLFDKTDLVIESASSGVVPEVIAHSIKNKRDLLIISIGGLLGREDLLNSAKELGITIVLPSGAISGVDALKASKLAGIRSVSLTTRKSPKSIKGAPYLAEKGIDPETINKETLIFEGNALEAMKGFPKNINVSALLSIAGLGSEQTKVRIVVSPEYSENIHEIEVESEAGSFKTVTRNVPSPENPKTSYLAALSAMASLEGYFNNLRIGT